MDQEGERALQNVIERSKAEFLSWKIITTAAMHILKEESILGSRQHLHICISTTQNQGLNIQMVKRHHNFQNILYA